MDSLMNLPFKFCEKELNENDQAIQYDIFNHWICINCNKVNCIDYKLLQNSNDRWHCILCCSKIFTFYSMKSNKNYFMYVSKFHNSNKPVSQ